MTEQRDELLERVVDELRTLPPVDEGAIASIVERARADRSAHVERPTGPHSWLRSRIPLAAAAGLAIAAGLSGFLIGTARDPVVTGRSEGIVAGAESLRLASTPTPLPVDGSAVRVPTQFVLDAPNASRVSLVGDFNAWSPNTTPLTRVSPRGLWTVTVPLAPGRHTYAFMVDGTTLTLDPRAPTSRDADFGTPSSVILVGTP